MKWKQLYLLPICLFMLVCVYFLPIKVNAYNMKGWNISNTLVFNIDDNKYTYPNGFMSSVVKARWGIDNQTFQNGQYYQVSTNIFYRQKAKKSQLRNCAINVNGAYIDAVNYTTNIWSECGEGYCDNQYNITSYFNGEDLTNVPVFIQCDLYTDAEFSQINYNYKIAHEAQNTNNDSGIINSINNNGQQIVDTNNYNANQNNANRDANTNKIIGELKGQHSLASEYAESTKVCTLQPNVEYTLKTDEFAYKDKKLTNTGIVQTATGWNTTEYRDTTTNDDKYPYRLYIYPKETQYCTISFNGFWGEKLAPVTNSQYYKSNTTNYDGTFNERLEVSISKTTLGNNGIKFFRISTNCTGEIAVRAINNAKLTYCIGGNQAIADNQEKQNGILGQIKDTINNTYNTLVGTITNVIQGIGETISQMFNWFTNTNLDTSRLNTLINRLQDSSPPIFSIITSLKNYVQSFNPNTTCQPISISLNTKLNNHKIEIPCGTTLFWNRQDVNTFKTWWNLFVGGLLIYSIGLKLIKVIDGAFDPQKDEVGKGLEV